MDERLLSGVVFAGLFPEQQAEPGQRFRPTGLKNRVYENCHEIYMIYFVLLCIVCVILFVTCRLILKKYKCTKAINMVMNNFDYFLTSICIEQTSNKYFIFCTEWKDDSVMQNEFSEISALSYIECVCVSICIFISNERYTPNDKIYILKIIKNNYRIMKKCMTII